MQRFQLECIPVGCMRTAHPRIDRSAHMSVCGPVQGEVVLSRGEMDVPSPGQDHFPLLTM